MAGVTSQDRKIVSLNGVIAAVLSTLIAAAVLGGISLGRSDASQDERIDGNNHAIRSVESRMDRERERTTQQVTDLKDAIRDLSNRNAQDTGELRSLMLQMLAKLSVKEEKK